MLLEHSNVFQWYFSTEEDKCKEICGGHIHCSGLRTSPCLLVDGWANALFPPNRTADVGKGRGGHKCASLHLDTGLLKDASHELSLRRTVCGCYAGRRSMWDVDGKCCWMDIECDASSCKAENVEDLIPAIPSEALVIPYDILSQNHHIWLVVLCVFRAEDLAAIDPLQGLIRGMACRKPPPLEDICLV